ncbi:MAG TPA: hypothetical protein ENI57_09500 [Ignavibacteria bacterium]|nr:hypothetical protein [Ignavibacteria bacterium]
MKNIIIILFLGFLFLTGCSNNKGYKFVKEIKLEGMNPISAAVGKTGIWVSDSKNNRVIKINESGKILEEFNDFKRPMHISLFKGKVYIPEFLNDSIKVIGNGKVLNFNLGIKPNAPAGIDVAGSFIAVADFYNHRIIVKNGDSTYTIGKKGHKNGELFYPTDVKIVKDKIVVADAYNNRVQVFNREGKFISAIGYKDSIKVATGIDADANEILVTDSGNNRVLIYNWKGKRIGTLTKSLNYPIDVFIDRDEILISNFYKGIISVYKK